MNYRMTNAELLAEAAAQLETGNPVVIDKVATRNPDFTTIFVAGKVEGIGSAVNGGSVSKFEADMLGWSEPILRSHFNCPTARANDISVGDTLEDVVIEVKDSNEPQYEGQNERVTRNGDIIVDDEGNLIYRSTKLVYKSEFKGHSLKTGHVLTEAEATTPVANEEAIVS